MGSRGPSMQRKVAAGVLGVAAGGLAFSYGFRGQASCQSPTHPLDSLWATIQSRKGADPESSWTAKLLNKGVSKCAQKVGEEATEDVIEAVQGNKEGVIKESADLIYHLQVTWAVVGVTPEDV